MIILDPDRSGCTVWYAGTVQYIRGTPEECAERIIRNFSDENGQFYSDIFLDANGIGIVYADVFDYRNFKYHKVTRGSLIK